MPNVLVVLSGWWWLGGRAAGPSKLLRQLGRAANRVVGQLLAACLLAQPPTLGGQSHLLPSSPPLPAPFLISLCHLWEAKTRN